MRHKYVTTTISLIVLCLSSASFVLAHPVNSQNKQRELSKIKDKRLIFVEVSNETTKKQIEEFFRQGNHFQVVQDLKDAELVYSAGLAVETRPSFGTVEQRSVLPTLASNERPGLAERKNEAAFRKIEYEHRRKTRAFVYLLEQSGTRLTVWSNETLRITKSTEPGATSEFLRKSGEELSLAKRFVKELKR